MRSGVGAAKSDFASTTVGVGAEKSEWSGMKSEEKSDPLLRASRRAMSVLDLESNDGSDKLMGVIGADRAVVVPTLSLRESS